MKNILSIIALFLVLNVAFSEASESYTDSASSDEECVLIDE